MAKYKDLSDRAEDARIKQIGDYAMARGTLVAFVVDAEPDQAKAKRYIDKLTKRYPRIEVVDEFPGPTLGVYTVRVRRAKGETG